MSKNNGKMDLGQTLQVILQQVQAIAWRQRQLELQTHYQQRHDAQRRKSDKLNEQLDVRNEQSNRHYEQQITDKQQMLTTDKRPTSSARITGEQQRLSLSVDPLRQNVDQMLTSIEATQTTWTQDTDPRHRLDQTIARVEAARKRREMHVPQMKPINYQLPALPTLPATVSDEDDIARWKTQLVPAVNPVTPLPVTPECKPEITETETPQRRIEYRINEKKLLRERLLAAALYYSCKYEQKPDVILMSRNNYVFVLPILQCRPAYKYGYPLDDTGTVIVPYGVDDTLDDETIAVVGNPKITNKLSEND
jgi:hypothetical protein